MTKKAPTSARKPREAKYFKLNESSYDSSGEYYSEYASWWVYKKRKGFYLRAGELGEVCGPCATISEALAGDGTQYGAEHAEIDTNLHLEELFEIMLMYNFEPFMHNLSQLILNGVEIDVESFKNFVMWYAECSKASAGKKT
jgi:hypothetical protein